MNVPGDRETLQNLIDSKLVDLADQYEKHVRAGCKEYALIVESQAMSLCEAADGEHNFFVYRGTPGLYY